MKRSRLVLAAVLAGTFMLAGVGPASARYTHPDAPTEMVEVKADTARIGRATKWRPNRFLTASAGGHVWSAWVAYEPYRNVAGGAFLRVRGNGGVHVGGPDYQPFYTYELQSICEDSAGEVYETAAWHAGGRGGYNTEAQDGVYPERYDTLTVDSASVRCALDELVGIRIKLVVEDRAIPGNPVIAESGVHVWHVRNENRGPDAPDDWSENICEVTFGPPPWYPGQTGVIHGEVVAIEDTDCLDLQDDWGRDFSKVCADPPDFEFYTVLGISVFPTVGSLGDWIGHYATCLFVPQRGFETDAIGVAAEGGWMGSTRTILASVAADFGGSGSGGASALIEYERNHEGGPPRAEFPGVSFGGVEFEDQETARSWLGDGLVDSVATPPVVPLRGSNFGPMAAGCGEFVESLPVVGEGISSCSLGGVWPEHFRTAAGALLMITAAFSALFAILRFMGVRYGWNTG